VGCFAAPCAAGAASLRQLASTLGDVSDTLNGVMPDMLTDASLVLHSSAKPLLDGVHCAQVGTAVVVLVLMYLLNLCRSAYTVEIS
jgi:hypothetical protein